MSATLRPWAQAAVVLVALALLVVSTAVLGPAVGPDLGPPTGPVDLDRAALGLLGVAAAVAVLAARPRAVLS